MNVTHTGDSPTANTSEKAAQVAKAASPKAPEVDDLVLRTPEQEKLKNQREQEAAAPAAFAKKDKSHLPW